MAVTARIYGLALKSIFNKEIDFDSDVIKVMLCTSSYVPDLDAHDYKSDITNEVSGTGYTAGGATLASKTVTYTAANSWTTARANSTAYSVGTIVRPATGNGRIYRCIVAGTSGASIPTWPVVSGQTVTDGGVTWAECGTGAIVFDAADTSWANSTITARYAIVYDDSPATDATKPLLACVDFGEDVISAAGAFTITWAATGIFAITV